MLKAREDPWPSVEKQIETMLADLTVQIHQIENTKHPTLMAEKEVLDTLANCKEVIEDMRFAYDSVVEHPESFSIPTEEFQRRAVCLRTWESSIMQLQQAAEGVRAAHRARLQNNEVILKNSKREKGDFIAQEYETQQNIKHADEHTLDRLAGGIERVKQTAINVKEEMVTQEHVLDDIDRGMSRVQVRLDSTIRKVSHLLDKTSDRGKMICIVVLFIILIVLIFCFLK